MDHITDSHDFKQEEQQSAQHLSAAQVRKTHQDAGHLVLPPGLEGHGQENSLGDESRDDDPHQRIGTGTDRFLDQACVLNPVRLVDRRSRKLAFVCQDPIQLFRQPVTDDFGFRRIGIGHIDGYGAARRIRFVITPFHAVHQAAGSQVLFAERPARLQFIRMEQAHFIHDFLIEWLFGNDVAYLIILKSRDFTALSLQISHGVVIVVHHDQFCPIGGIGILFRDNILAKIPGYQTAKQHRSLRQQDMHDQRELSLRGPRAGFDILICHRHPPFLFLPDCFVLPFFTGKAGAKHGWLRPVLSHRIIQQPG